MPYWEDSSGLRGQSWSENPLASLWGSGQGWLQGPASRRCRCQPHGEVNPSARPPSSCGAKAVGPGSPPQLASWLSQGRGEPGARTVSAPWWSSPGVQVLVSSLSATGMVRSDRVELGTMGMPSSAALWLCSPAVHPWRGTVRLAAMPGGCGVVALESQSQLGHRVRALLPTIVLPVPKHTVAVPVGSRGAGGCPCGLRRRCSVRKPLQPSARLPPPVVPGLPVSVAPGPAAPPAFQTLMPCFPLPRLWDCKG